MKNKFKWIILLSSLIFCLSAQADVVAHLNTAQLPVADHSSQALNQAFSTAFDDVLIKMTGNPSIGTLPAIQSAKSNIKRYVQSFNYVTQTPKASIAEGQSIQTAQLFLQITFDKTALKHLIQQAGQTIWDPNRPQTLVWIKIQ